MNNIFVHENSLFVRLIKSSTFVIIILLSSSLTFSSSFFCHQLLSSFQKNLKKLRLQKLKTLLSNQSKSSRKCFSKRSERMKEMSHLLSLPFLSLSLSLSLSFSLGDEDDDLMLKLM